MPGPPVALASSPMRRKSRGNLASEAFERRRVGERVRLHLEVLQGRGEGHAEQSGGVEREQPLRQRVRLRELVGGGRGDGGRRRRGRLGPRARGARGGCRGPGHGRRGRGAGWETGAARGAGAGLAAAAAVGEVDGTRAAGVAAAAARALPLPAAASPCSTKTIPSAASASRSWMGANRARAPARSLRDQRLPPLQPLHRDVRRRQQLLERIHPARRFVGHAVVKQLEPRQVYYGRDEHIPLRLRHLALLLQVAERFLDSAGHPRRRARRRLLLPGGAAAAAWATLRAAARFGFEQDLLHLRQFLVAGDAAVGPAVHAQGHEPRFDVVRLLPQDVRRAGNCSARCAFTRARAVELGGELQRHVRPERRPRADRQVAGAAEPVQASRSTARPAPAARPPRPSSRSCVGLHRINASMLSNCSAGEPRDAISSHSHCRACGLSGLSSTARRVIAIASRSLRSSSTGIACVAAYDRTSAARLSRPTTSTTRYWIFCSLVCIRPR